jgi:hypothetical protein
MKRAFARRSVERRGCRSNRFLRFFLRARSDQLSRLPHSGTGSALADAVAFTAS